MQVLLDQPERPEALHYRDWYERLVTAGYAVGGKDAPSTPEITADLAAIRAGRAELTSDIARTERALEEADSLLGPRQHLPRATG